MWLSVTNGVTNSSDVTPPTDLQGVKGWADMSGSNNFVCKLAGAQMIYHVSGGTGPGGAAYVASVGAGGGAEALTNNAPGTQSKGTNVFFWIATMTGNGNPQLNGASTGQDQMDLTGAGVMQLFDGTTATSAGFAQNRWMPITAEFNGASTKLRTNGVNMTLTGSVGTTAMSGITIGNYSVLAGSGFVSLSEFLWYSGNDMTTNTMHQIEAWLAAKYGLPVF